MVLRLGPGEHAHDCVVILEAVVVPVDPFVRVYLGITGCVVQGLVCSAPLQPEGMLPVPVRIMNRRKPIVTLVAHPVQLGARLNIRQRGIAGVNIIDQPIFSFPFAPTHLNLIYMLAGFLGA